MTEPNRITGCLIGGALGDALGHAYEGASCPVIVAADAPKRLSDETQLTTATCEAVCAAGRVDPQTIAAKFAEWFAAGRIGGVGSSTLKALRDLKAGAHWALAGASGDRAAGNGAAMRIAPLAFTSDPADIRGRRDIRDVANITHKNDAAYVGALAVVVAIRLAALSSSDLDQLPTKVAAEIPDSLVRDNLLKIQSLPHDAPPVDIVAGFGNSGFVAESVPVAIHLARSANRLSMLDLLRRAVECGGDTDTIASMTGQIVGARVGLEHVPVQLVADLEGFHLVRTVAGEFAQTWGKSV